MDEMVGLDHLVKKFGPLTAVDDMTFWLKRGEVLGFLGPNGAGKSTTMRLLTGFLLPTSGTARVMGFDVIEQPTEVKRRVGYLPEGAPLYGDMNVGAFLAFVAEMRGFWGAEKRRRVGEAAEKTNIASVMHRPIEALSKGFKRRVGLAQAILHDPPVLILDEPTDGLDPNQKHDVRELILAMAADKAIIISTHILEEVSAVCTRAIVIANGRLVADSTPQELQQRSMFHYAVTVRLETSLVPRLTEFLAVLPEVRELRTTSVMGTLSDLVVVPHGRRDLMPAIERILAEQKIPIDGWRPEHGRLEEVFRDLTRSDRASVH